MLAPKQRKTDRISDNSAFSRNAPPSLSESIRGGSKKVLGKLPRWPRLGRLTSRSQSASESRKRAIVWVSVSTTKIHYLTFSCTVISVFKCDKINTSHHPRIVNNLNMYVAGRTIVQSTPQIAHHHITFWWTCKRSNCISRLALLTIWLDVCLVRTRTK